MIESILPNGQCPHCGWYILKSRRGGDVKLHCKTVLAKSNGNTVVVCGRSACGEEVAIPKNYHGRTSAGIIRLVFMKEAYQ